MCKTSCLRPPIIILLIVGGAFSLVLIILFSVLDTHTGVLCDRIYSLNPGQQRICKPSAFWEDVYFAGEGVTAYAFGENAFRRMGTRLSNNSFDETETILGRDFRYWNLTGTGIMTLHYRYKASGPVDVGVLDDNEFRSFIEGGPFTGNIINYSVSDISRTINNSTYYHIVVRNPQSSTVTVRETGWYAGESYDFLPSLARETCTGMKGCVLDNNIHDNLVVILEYGGTNRSYNNFTILDKYEVRPWVIAILPVYMVVGGVAIALFVLTILCLCAVSREKNEKKLAEKTTQTVTSTPPVSINTPLLSASASTPGGSYSTVGSTPSGPYPGDPSALSVDPVLYPDGLPPPDFPYKP